MSTSPENQLAKLGTFLILALFGVFALGPLQWNNIPIGEDARLARVLNKYEALLGPRTANLLQAIVFCTIHLSVAYTPEPYLFVALAFFLGLAWGWVAQRTDNLLASVLFHPGTDIPIILSIFPAL